MDVNIAFLNGNFDEEICMDQPIGFESRGQGDKVCCLKRSIYGLKQSFMLSLLGFHEAIISFGLTMVSKTLVCMSRKL